MARHLAFHSCFALALGLAAAPTVRAQSFVTTTGNQIYEFTGTSTGDNQFNAISAQPANATFSTFTRTNVSWAAAANVFNSSNWTVGGSAIDPTKYISFNITPSAGFQLELSSLTFDSQRSGTGPLNGEVRSSFDGFATAFTFAPPTALAANNWDFADFTSAFPVEFRFYGYGATGTAGTFRVDNVFVTGGVSPVPEPASVLALCAVAGVAYRLRRRFKPAAA